MKFTRYLEDTQTPEWKRAYIDYQIFKERIRAIRGAQDGLVRMDSYSNSQLNHQDGSMLSVIVQSDSGENSAGTSSVHLPLENRDLTFAVSPTGSRSRGRAEGPSNHSERRLSLHRTHTSHSNTTPPSPGPVAATNPGRNPKITLPRLVVRQPTNHSHPTPSSPGGEVATLNSRHIKHSNISRPAITRQWTNNSARQGDMVPPSPAVPPSSPASRVMRGLHQLIYPSRRHPYSQLSLDALLPQLSPQELAFFAALDNELLKVENFYTDREKAMKIRTRELEAQLRELDEHRRLFDATHPEHSFSWTTSFHPRTIFSSLIDLRQKLRTGPADTENTDIPRISVDDVSKKDEERMENERWHEHLDPKAYLSSRRKLKKAVLEHYRGLEMLHNYRVLNIYGFRRVLQKFEKATKIPAQRAYMEEKVEKTAFSTDETLRRMMTDMQNIFADSFAKGDRKKAITRLHAGPQYKSHHNSTFWSGIALGSASAALGSGVAHSTTFV
ncbi:SPX domain-containing protein [Mycena maculata]|uniref:SPX domain-containing protein n=1 Tax=Mycena maculata TaxID=230809 RepID=A0AAD7N0B9_9AGAR|nr:SPX domain-containing protein [Mycena maculata]